MNHYISLSKAHYHISIKSVLWWNLLMQAVQNEEIYEIEKIASH